MHRLSEPRSFTLTKTAALVLCVVLAVSVSAFAVAIARHSSPRAHAASQHQRAAKQRSSGGEDSAATGTMSFRAEQVTIAQPTTGQPSNQSAASALQSFKNQQVPQSVIDTVIDSQDPTVSFASVTEGSPSSQEVSANTPFAAWVVMYQTSPAGLYGPGTLPENASCAFVGIQDSATGDWVNFFQSCSPRSPSGVRNLD